VHEGKKHDVMGQARDFWRILRVASDTKTRTQYHHNTFFSPKEVTWTCISSCLLSSEKATTGFSMEEGPQTTKVFGFSHLLHKAVNTWCDKMVFLWHQCRAETQNTPMDLHGGPSCVVHKIIVFTVFF